jgi:hypothetical protein
MILVTPSSAHAEHFRIECVWSSPTFHREETFVIDTGDVTVDGEAATISTDKIQFMKKSIDALGRTVANFYTIDRYVGTVEIQSFPSMPGIRSGSSVTTACQRLAANSRKF